MNARPDRHASSAFLTLGCLLLLGGVGAQAASFSWEEGVSGTFTDPNRWHGPEYPAHTSYPKAGDDASIIRGALTVSIPGNQATRELVINQATLDISGTYTVDQLSAYGSRLIITGGGEFDAALWLMGAQAILDGTKATVGTWQPLADSPKSEVVIRQGAEITSRSLDTSRGGLRVVVEGPGALWKHTAELPFMELLLQSGGRAELLSTRSLFFDVNGPGTVLHADGRLEGYGRIANGARIECPDAIHPLSGGFTVIDHGTWSIRNTFIQDAGDLTLTNGGVLIAKDIQPGEFSSLTVVEGAGSRITVSNLLNPSGTIQMKREGALTSARAELDRGGLYAETGGSITVAGDILCNNGLSLDKGGLMKASGVFLATQAGRGGGMNIRGMDSLAVVSGALVAGMHGEGELRLSAAGRLQAESLTAAAEVDSVGRVSVAGASRGEFATSMTIGARGRGELSLSDGATVRVGSPKGDSPPPTLNPTLDADCNNEPTSGPGAGMSVILGKESGSQGIAFLEGPATAWEIHGDLIIGDQGGNNGPATGSLTIQNGATLTADGPYVTLGKDRGHGTLILDGPESRLHGNATLEIGRHGSGTLRLLSGAKLTAPSTILGCLTDSSGSVEVIGTAADGLPSTYESLGSLTIGNRTTGSVSIAAGGMLKSSGNAILGRFPDAFGTATLSGPDSRWRHGSDPTAAAPGPVVIGDQGHGRFSILDNAHFEVGEVILGRQGSSATQRAEGMLLLRNGGTMVASGQFVTLGQERFSQGTLFIDGTTSKLEGIKDSSDASGATLEIGRHGDGTLILTNGASLKLPSTILAFLGGSSGTVRVGKASTFETDGSLTVGGSSTGWVEVSSGGRMMTSRDVVIGRSEGSRGTITLLGQEARWRHTRGEDGDAGGEIAVGEASRGELTVMEGAQVEAPSLILGKTQNGRGEVTVDGPLSRVDVEELAIGSAQPADENDADSPLVFGGGSLSIANRGILTVRPASAESVFRIISPPDQPSQLQLKRSGQLIAENTALELGGPGRSEMRIESGSAVDSASAIVGSGPGPASVDLDGSDGQFAVWTLKARDRVADRLVVGGNGEGTLHISGLAQVLLRQSASSTGGVRIAREHSGRVEVDGKGLRNGGRSAALMAPAASLDVGSGVAPGILDILGGGEVAAESIHLHGPDATTVRVQDDNSKLTASKSIDVRSGSRLTVDSKGHIAAGTTLEVRHASVSILGDGTCDIGPLPPVSARTGFGQLRLFSGIGPAGAPTGIKPLIIENGSVQVSRTLSLRSALFIESSPPWIKASAVSAQLVGGSMTIGAPSPVAAPNTVQVNTGGLVTGIGLIVGPEGVHALLVRNGGTCDLMPYSFFDIQPQQPLTLLRKGPQRTRSVTTVQDKAIRQAAASPPEHGVAASLWIDGDYEQTSDGVLNVVVTGPEPLADHGVLEVTGRVRLAGKLNILFANGFAPKQGEAFGILKFASNPGTAFDQVAVTGLGPGFQYQMEQTPSGTLQLRSLNDGVAISSPALSITHEEDEWIISWPSAAPGWMLESATDMDSSRWQLVPADFNRAAILPEGARRFFRLRK